MAQLVKYLSAVWEVWVGKISGEGKGYPLQHSGLENSMDCIVKEITKSQTRLINFYFDFTFTSYYSLGGIKNGKNKTKIKNTNK